MRRRQLLAATAALAGAAGCATGRPAALDAETVQEAEETHLVFRDGERRMATLTARHAGATAARVPLTVSVAHADGTTIDSVRLELRAPPAGVEVPAPVYLRAPGGNPFPDVGFTTARDDGATVVEIADTGAQGDGTLTLEFLVEPPEPRALRVAAEFTLSGGTFSRYRAEGATTLSAATLAGDGGEQA